jgi:heterodisulfide reductase subunit B
MAHYLYFPGCCKHATGKPYHMSTEAVCAKLGIEMTELEDWNCCGSTSYISIRELEAFGVSSRNLAIAQRMGGEDVIATCNACYTVLSKTNRYLAASEELRETIGEALAVAGLKYDGNVEVRHLLDVIVNDVGLQTVGEKVTKRLTKLRVAPYYGCQLSRPNGTFDDPELPVTMDRLLEAIGADPVYYPVKTKCCSGLFMMYNEAPALRLCYELLKCAVDNGADLIVTACSLCEMNLEAYQHLINKHYGTNFNIPVLYFTQLLGVALGVDPKDLALDKQIVPADAVLAAIPA